MPVMSVMSATASVSASIQVDGANLNIGIAIPF
jgi:hypothetical protein